MTKQRKSVADWQTNLERAFVDERGVLGPRLQQLDKSEREHAFELTQRLAGFTALVESYQDFVIQSLHEVLERGRDLNILSYAYHVAVFQRFRVALNDFYGGYYYDAFGTLRGVFEAIMFVGAVLQGHMSFDEFDRGASVEEIRNKDSETTQRRRRQQGLKVEKRIRQCMYGKESALTRDEQRQIQHLLMCLHTSVHRSEANVAHLVVDAASCGRMPQIAPRVDLEKASVFCNSAALLAWAHLRTLTYASWPVAHSTEWRDKLSLLDESFRYFFEYSETPYFSAILHLIDTSFRFEEDRASRQLLSTGAGGGEGGCRDPGGG